MSDSAVMRAGDDPAALKCPACGRALAHLDAGGFFLDVCQDGCGGIWFDNFELQKLDEAHELTDSPVFEVRPGALGARPASGGAARKAAGAEAPKRICPRCPGQKMRRGFFSVKKKIEVDECPNCGGDWLDHDELQQIRGEFATAADREAAAMAQFDDLFGAQMAEARAESQAKVDRARKFANMFKAICPSAWIPGKQDGAAF